MKLLFIHGRAQENRNPDELKREWIDALEVGLGASGLSLPVKVEDVSLPYYGDRLLKLTEGLDQIEKDMVEKGGPVSDPMLEFEAAAFIELARSAGISEEDILRSSNTEITSKGPQNWAWVRAIVRTLDRWNGGLSAEAIKLILRDVFVYCTRSGIAAEIDDIVRADLSEEPTVIVAHSLGTVVAYNLLRREIRSLNIPLLVTLGSPLGISAVRRELVPLRAPKVALWLNAFDPRDIVALNPLDSVNFAVTPAVENKGDVDNSTDNRHGISGYLSDPVVARRIYEGLAR